MHIGDTTAKRDKTMPYVYVLSNPSYPEGTYKIGHTTKSVKNRMKELDSTGVLTPFKLEAQYEVSDSFDAEKQIHEDLKQYRLNKSREFFGNGITLDVIHLSIVNRCDALGADTLSPKALKNKTIAKENQLNINRENKRIANEISLAHEEALGIEAVIRWFKFMLATSSSEYEYHSKHKKELDKIKSSLPYKLIPLWNVQLILTLQFQVDHSAKPRHSDDIEAYLEQNIFYADIGYSGHVTILEGRPRSINRITTINISCVKHLLIKLAIDFSNSHEENPYYKNINERINKYIK
jgi:hypothetical protein